MEWLNDHQWESWMALALVLGVAELFSLDLVLIMLASGAVAGALSATLGAPVVLQVIIALVVSVVMLGVVRPTAKRRLDSGPDLVLGHSRLIGRSGSVLTELGPDRTGQVKVDGEVWSALPYDETLTIAAGEPVEVLEIRGATAYVHPVARLEP